MNKPNLPDWFIECALAVFIAATILMPFVIHLAFEYRL